jgi:hypothetical protein
MRRRPMMRRGPGIVGAMARTAVVAGTATVAVKGVSGAMDSHAQAQQQAQMQQQQPAVSATQPQADTEQTQTQMAQQPAVAQPAQTVPLPQVAPGADLATQLQQLAQLKESGALSDAEFQAAKSKLLGM